LKIENLDDEGTTKKQGVAGFKVVPKMRGVSEWLEAGQGGFDQLQKRRRPKNGGIREI
jgi:hypothetical protein